MGKPEILSTGGEINPICLPHLAAFLPESQLAGCNLADRPDISFLLGNFSSFLLIKTSNKIQSAFDSLPHNPECEQPRVRILFKTF